MHQFVVVDSADFYTGIASIPGTERLSIYPNPANDMISFEGEFEESGVLRIYDIYGRLIRKEVIGSLKNTTISVHDLPRGVIIFEFTSGSKRFVSKVSLN
ncbi:MAG: T9SS type A sorting domain-containing protein [Bacteroidota bacterium]|nr:T9SS type A sorting domain-containing protein [Bacteroidota bacterium]